MCIGHEWVLGQDDSPGTMPPFMQSVHDQIQIRITGKTVKMHFGFLIPCNNAMWERVQK